VEDRNKEAIEKQLQLNNIDWDAVVKVSTAHYVFPALYCNLQRANLLHYLPDTTLSHPDRCTLWMLSRFISCEFLQKIKVCRF